MSVRKERCRREFLRLIIEGRRYLIAAGISDSELRVGSCLYGNPEAWSILAIAEATGMTRLTVRRVLREWETIGYVERSARGYYITHGGLAYLRRIIDRFLEAHSAIFLRLCGALPAIADLGAGGHF